MSEDIERWARMARTGQYEPEDFSAVDAMLREAGEEEGLSREQIEAKLTTEKKNPPHP